MVVWNPPWIKSQPVQPPPPVQPVAPVQPDILTKWKNNELPPEVLQAAQVPSYDDWKFQSYTPEPGWGVKNPNYVPQQKQSQLTSSLPTGLLSKFQRPWEHPAEAITGGLEAYQKGVVKPIAAYATLPPTEYGKLNQPSEVVKKYEQTKMPWGVKGTAETLLDPLMWIGSETKVAKGVLEQGVKFAEAQLAKGSAVEDIISGLSHLKIPEAEATKIIDSLTGKIPEVAKGVGIDILNVVKKELITGRNYGDLVYHGGPSGIKGNIIKGYAIPDLREAMRYAGKDGSVYVARRVDWEAVEGTTQGIKPLLEIPIENLRTNLPILPELAGEWNYVPILDRAKLAEAAGLESKIGTRNWGDISLKDREALFLALKRQAEEPISQITKAATKIPEVAPKVGGIVPPNLSLLDSAKAKISAALDIEEQAIRKTQQLRSVEAKARVARGTAIMETKMAEGDIAGAFKEGGTARGGKMPFEAGAVTNQFTPEEWDAVGLHIYQTEKYFHKAQNTYNALLDLMKDLSVKERPLQLNEVKLIKNVFGLGDAPVSKMKKLGNIIVDIINFPKSWMSSGDFSGTFRQAMSFVGIKSWREAWKPSMAAFTSEGGARAIEDLIVSDPIFQFSKDAGLSLTAMTKGGPLTSGALYAMEEAFPSRVGESLGKLTEKIPNRAKIALDFIGTRASERQYTGFLNYCRFFEFKDAVKLAEDMGKPLTLAEAKRVAAFINTCTGRASLGRKAKIVASVFNIPFFSPQWVASVFQQPFLYAKLPGRLMPHYTAQLAKVWGTIAGLVGMVTLGSKMGYLPGVSVSTDMDSSDFAKIKIGNTRLDPWGGRQQYAVFFHRMVTTMWQMYKEGKNPWSTPGDLLVRMVRMKTSPTFGLVLDYMYGDSIVGDDMRKMSLADLAMNHMMQMGLRDVMQGIQDAGIWGGILASPTLFGIGVQTYEAKPPKPAKQQTVIPFKAPIRRK